MVRRSAFLLLVIVAFLAACPAAAQEEGSEPAAELEKRLSGQDSGEKLNTLNRIALAYIDAGQMEAAQETAQRMLDLAEELGNTRARLTGLTRLAQSLYIQGNYYHSIKYLQEIVQIHRQQGNTEREAGFLNFLANASVETGDNEKALNSYSRALKLYQQLDDPEGQAGVLNNIALIYKNQGNTSKELEYYYEALEVARAAGIKLVEAIAMANIAESLVLLGDLDEAGLLLKEALVLSQEIENADNTVFSLKELANLNLARGDLATARRYSDQAEAMAREHGFEKDLFMILLKKAEIALAADNYQKALDATDEAEDLVGRLELNLEESEPYLLKAMIYEEMGDFGQALVFYKKYEELKDAAYQKARDEKVMQLQAQFEFNQKEQQIQEAQEELEAQKERLRNLLLFSGLLVLLIGVLAWFYYSKSRANRLIREKNKELEEAYEQMESLARTDDLTGLHNRRSFKAILEHEKDRQQRNDKPFSIIVADIDHFKRINDTYGHDGGDRVLQWVAESIKSIVRKQDAVSRWGGEEFLLLLPETDQEGALELAEKLNTFFDENDYELNGETVSLTLTLGAAECRKGADADKVIELADKAMYIGKERGRNQVQSAAEIAE